MKKFFVPLFLLLIFGCSNEEIKLDDRAAKTQKDNSCYVEHNHNYYKSISESLCIEIGGEPGKHCPTDVCFSSSSDEELSSSSRGNISRSSSSVVAGSSSSVVSGSSSSVVAGSSSSGGAGSSSSVVSGSSSSVVAGSSSSVVAGSSSSVIAGSSSSVVAGSSSSSSISSSSSAPPSLECLSASAYPYYVAKTKKEPISNFVLNNGCGNVTYTVPSGGGSSYASTDGDTISFANASATPRNITIRATAASSQCSLPKECPITVIIADDYREAKCHDSFPANLNTINKELTFIEYACCEPKHDYYIQCTTPNYTLKIGNTTLQKNPNDANGTNLPDVPLIEKPYAECPAYGDSPGGILYQYPNRVLMTAQNPPQGGFSCDSW